MYFQSDKIYTVIKTSPMWGDVSGTREAVFKVNQKAHLISLLTMIGPSPDWCIGKKPDCPFSVSEMLFTYLVISKICSHAVFLVFANLNI